MKPDVSHTVSRFVDVGCGWAAVAVIAAVFLAVCPAAARGELPSMAEVERAVLAADAGHGSLQDTWMPVIRLLKDVNEQTPDPVLRMLKGHAGLAVNENNESVCLFLSVQTVEDHKRWLKWAEDFAKRHSVVPIAHYFHGDALARLGQWEDAVASFTSAIEQAPGNQHAPAVNARGVVYAHQGDFTKARLDFAYAVSCSDSCLADAYANIGALRIQKKSGLKGALEAFDHALEICPDFALALHGKVCVKAANAMEIAEVDKKTLTAALQECPSGLLKKLMLANEERIRAFWDGRESEYFLAMLGSGEDVGTTIDSTVSSPFKAFMRDVDNGVGHFEGFRNQHHFNAGFKDWTDMRPAEQMEEVGKLNSWAAESRVRQDALRRCSTVVDTWNEHGGGADIFNQNLATVGGVMTLGGAATSETGVGLGVAGAGLATIAGAGRLQSNRNKYHEGISDFNSQLNLGNTPSLPMSPAGGVDMNLADVHCGDAMWPFVAYYGLAYDIVKFENPFAQAQVEASPHGLEDPNGGTAQQGPSDWRTRRQTEHPN